MKFPINYNNVIQAYATDQISVISQCSEITFINYGQSLMLLNGTLPIQPNGGSISFDGKQFEKDNTVYYFSFDNSNPALLNGCCVVKKTYDDYPNTNS